MRSFVIATALTLGGTVAAAEQLEPIQATSIKLGSVQGVAYYTVEPDGLRLVTTVSAGEATFRFTSTLVRDQKITLSVPGLNGAAEREIVFERLHDRVHVAEPAYLKASGELRPGY